MDIFGISIAPLKKSDLFAKITLFQKQTIVFTPNPEILLKAKNDIVFKSILDQATFLTSDGIGLYLAYQILEKNTPFFLSLILFPYYLFNLFFRRRYLYDRYGERICGSDLTKDLLDFAQKNNKEIAIIDLYNPGDIKKSASQDVFVQKMQENYPQLKIHFFIWNPQKKEENLQTIKDSNTTILFSTLGMKAQEENIIEVMKQCPQIMLGLGVGSSFDSISGLQKRAPKIWRDIGLEWLYRLIFGPKKIKRLQRLWNAIFVFIYEVYKDKMRS